ncbi:hypothetical protein QYE76_063039 [Lolium multiflorum]|uniref:DUF4216 domain-containing protein n=1 Tax=Lolium multiflorum TaxID=4521 RepID=A0AAD8S4R1_LOLMU|nr:hypothetical protein QYE76_063039 [Lolium multiflorum]
MNATDDEQLYLLAKQPSSTISTFQGYEINGNTFYTFAQDKKSTNQNSGVRFDAADDNGKKVTYYGYIEEIWELEYGPNFKVPLFRCKWFNLKDGVQVDPQYGMTTVDLKNLGLRTSPTHSPPGARSPARPAAPPCCRHRPAASPRAAAVVLAAEAHTLPLPRGRRVAHAYAALYLSYAPQPRVSAPPQPRLASLDSAPPRLSVPAGARLTTAPQPFG